MSSNEAKAWDGAVDERGCFVWVDKSNGQATCCLPHGNGLPLSWCPTVCGAQPAPMQMAPVQLVPMAVAAPNNWCLMQPTAPFAGMGWCHPQPRTGTVVVVGKAVEKDEWSRHCDENRGEWYYFNKRTKESTWEKPEGFDEEEAGDKPPPPEEPKKEEKKKPKGKYHSDRRGWL